MANLVNFSGLHDYEEFRLTDSEHINLMLQVLQREEVPIYLLFTDDRPIETRILSIDPERSCTLLDYSEELANVERLNISGIFVVADHDNTQYQYHVDAMAQTLGESGGFMIPIPKSMYLIQQRAAPRLDIPEADRVMCRLTSPRGESVDYPVLDISHEGLALLDGDSGMEISEGPLGTAELQLPDAHVELELTLVNQIVLYQPKMNRKLIRLGCALRFRDDSGERDLDAYLKGLKPRD